VHGAGDLKAEHTEALADLDGDSQLFQAIQDLDGAGEEYSSQYFGQFLNEYQIDKAHAEIAKMETASSRLYYAWQQIRDQLPTSTEIGLVVQPPAIWSRATKESSDEDFSPRRSRRFRQLVRLNERVRRTTEAATEALPVLRDQILYAHHFERNCMRLYGNETEREHTERLRDAEDMRQGLEQTLRTLQGDVESLRAQTQSLTLYAQMHLAIQVHLLTWILLVVTILGVVAAFVHH
jgi:hypothetical protein